MIYRKSIRETTGNKNNIAQSFKHNIFFDSRNTNIIPFVFEKPMYTTLGGTKQYYDQNPLAIFTNLVKPFIRFTFSANTSSFESTTFIKHDIYRIDWSLFNTVQSGFQANADESIQSDSTTTEIIEETDEITKEVKRKTIKRSFNEIKNEIKSSREPSVEPAGRNLKSINKPTVTNIQDALNFPIFSITATTTGITGNIYDLQIEQYVKKLGDYKTELFQDRCQYFIDTNFIFDVNVTSGLTEYKKFDNNGDIIDLIYNEVITGETTTKRTSIEEGDFKGVDIINGEYFTYFQVPDKPTFEYPTPEGQIDTFTPEIFWTNGENADEYIVQVNYNTGDTSFTGTVFSYIVPKLDKFKELSNSKINYSDTEFESSKTIRKYQLSLKSNKCLLYRVGNVKFIKNIFDVKQSVVTFSENKSICTQVNPIYSYVFSESDSPYIPIISGLTTPPSIINESPISAYSLSGLVSGSTITGATVQLIYPNSNFTTTTTNSVGEFNFSDLSEGVYTLNTSYRGYASNSTSIIISANTLVFIEIEIKWDDDYDIWNMKENDIIKY